MREERDGSQEKDCQSLHFTIAGFPASNKPGPSPEKSPITTDQGRYRTRAKEERSIPPKGSTHRGFATKPKATGR